MGTVGRRFSLAAIVGIVDQGLVSAANLAIGLVFIAFGDKTDYGIYVQLFALVMLSQSIQNALINGPWVTLGPKYQRRRSRALSAHLFRLQSIVSAALAGVGFIALLGAAYWLALPTLTTAVAVAFAVLIPGLWLREFARDFYFLRLQPERALAVYALSTGVILASLAVATVYWRINALMVLSILALSCWLSGLWGMHRARLAPFANHGRARPALAAAWIHSRWALPSVVLSWAFANSQLFVAASLLGATASADIAAARLLIMPAGVCVLGWSSIFLPNVSYWIDRGDFQRINKTLRFSLLGLWAIIIVYALILWAGYGFLLDFLLGDEYAGLLPLVGIWALYFMINAAVVGNNWILAAAGEYRLLFIYACATFAVTLPAMIAATWLFGTTGTLASLILAQAGQLGMLRGHGVLKVKQLWARPVPS